jgi:hypothetical protein
MAGDVRVTRKRIDEMENDLIATGGVWAVLPDELDPQVVTVDDVATNAITVKLPFMKSRYRLTVERYEETMNAGSGRSDEVPDPVAEQADEDQQRD